MQTPLVSILVPFKNTEAFIKACLVSVLNQTYTNWELLIVDDASSDSSFNIVKEFAENDHRIVLLKNSGNGIIDALRFAFKHSKGEFITRMDSDDVMHANKLEVLVTNLLKYGKQHVAIGLVNYFSKEGIKEGYKNYEIWLNNLTKMGRNYSEIYKECVIPSPCWMIHRSDLITCDAFNPNRYPEDYDLAFRFYKHNYKCIPCNDIIHDWRDYSSRTSRTHEHYAENHFIDIKLHYFLELDRSPNKTLIVWGAGNKGKTVAKTLIKKDIPFEWICDNPNKIGRDIYGKILKPFGYLKEINNPQSIITVANKEAQIEIKNYMKALNMMPIIDYIFFC
ncbi:glycosyltransferase family 2 protein [Flavivirga jejuensis]|uniref:Glycosyltransferase family 2 protein n=1 Tax=Flavivirga jejuensis TaxID=870487 RepID=A0ABT8WP51_9FLAO|nr:glycosyltransferase family 2 protein [Flavivirga jejuensis]MDO5974941.1 glycosyltransferase family 2 protein [Flavivirga jejuensis]